MLKINNISWLIQIYNVKMLASVMEDYASDYSSNTHEGSDQIDQTNHALSLKLQVLR